MSSHLNAQQISESILGASQGEAAEHLRDCAACAAEVQNWKNNFSAFRDVVRTWSDMEAEAAWAGKIAHQRRVFPRMFRIGAAVAALLIVGVFAEVHNLRQRVAPSAAKPEPPAITDALLMQQVDMELSRSVPRPMEPLSKLMDDGSEAVR